MSDLISRQAAIDALARTARENFKISDEFDHYLAGLIDGDNAIRQLPSVQPEPPIKEIVYCKDCIHHFYDGDIPYCNQIDYGYGWEDDDFCSFAERRTDE